MLTSDKRSFDDFYLSDEMRRALTSIGYEVATPVQSEAIPLILAGIDLTLQSQTGSGKTAAFAIPVIEMIEPSPGRIDVLVMTPTRELARQVCEEFEGLGQFKDLTATAIYGGTSYEKQFKALETASIVVATPGRLLDLAERKKIDLSQLRILVLDEADEMLSMGFRDDIEAVIEYLPEERQSLLCSATFTTEIEALANRILFYPETVSLSDDSVAAKEVSHHYYSVRGVGRPRDLIKVLEYEEPESALIFANTRRDTFSVTDFMKRHGYRAEVLNGDLPQKEREKTLAQLKHGKIDYIVATDVAARGIDISDLSHVVNYTLPNSAEVYIHRTGRTGRAGKKGKAISLIAPTEVDTFFQIKKMYDIKLREQALPSTRDIMNARQRRALLKLQLSLDTIDYLPYGGYLKVAEQLLNGGVPEAENLDREKLVARLLSLADRVLDGEFTRPDLATSPAKATAKPAGTSSEQDKPAKQDKPAESSEDTGSSPSRRRTRRGKSDGERDKSRGRSTDSKRRSDDQQQGGDEPKRRRTRRSSSSSDSSPAAPKEKPSQKDDNEASITTVTPHTKGPSSTRKMYMNMGKDAFDTPTDLVEMLCYMSGMDPEDFGKINLESSYSFVHVRQDYFDDVIAALHGQTWEEHKITAEPARK